MRVSLADFIRCSRLSVWQRLWACRNSDWDAGTSSVLRLNCPHGPEGVHRLLRQTAGGTSERKHTLPDILRDHDKSVFPHNQLQDSQCHPQ